jgi:polysaccharide pyruvyl transferase WcaK-like protein
MANITGRRKIHIIHVGNMANMGTQALLKSDVNIIRDIFNENVSVSVSTADVPGVRSLDLPVDAIFPTLIDIPYEAADSFAKKSGWTTRGFRYKIIALLSLFKMFIQMYFSLLSTILIRLGSKASYRPEIMQAMNECDVVVSCSDENFKESASLLPVKIYWLAAWWSLLSSKAWTILVARWLRKSVVMFPNSVGPFRTPIGRFLSKTALNNCTSVLIRDRKSYEIAAELGVKCRMILTSDTALLFEGSDISQLGKAVVGVCAGLYSQSLSMEKMQRYVLAHAEALDRVIERLEVYVVFLPHYVTGFRYDDLSISKMIRDRMRHQDKTSISNAKTIEEFKSLIDSVDLLVSSKMHPCVLAASSFVPSVCIAYDHKQTGFFSDLGLDGDVLSLHDLTGQKLYERIVDIWGEKKEKRRILETRVPILQRKVRDSITVALLSSLDK